MDQAYFIPHTQHGELVLLQYFEDMSVVSTVHTQLEPDVKCTFVYVKFQP